MTQLELNELNVMYGDFHAVKDISISIDESEIVTLLGPSGCGKTSILRAIAGFIKPSSGEVILNEKNITNTPPQNRDMGMIFQNYALWPHMKVSENVGYGLKLRGVEKEKRDERVRELLEQVQLADQYDKVPSELSGGQQQRVALARALAVDPKVLLCDEPLSNLDFKLRVELRNEIRDIAKNFGVTVVYVTHDQTEALAISDKIAVIEKGVLIQEDSPLKIFNDPGTHFVGKFVGENNLLTGVIQERGKNYTLVKLDSGDIIKCGPISQNIGEETRIDLIIRHDKIEIGNSSEEVIQGLIKYNSFMGNYVQIGVELGNGLEISANITEDIEEVVGLTKGSEISLYVEEGSVLMFDKKGLRIR